MTDFYLEDEDEDVGTLVMRPGQDDHFEVSGYATRGQVQLRLPIYTHEGAEIIRILKRFAGKAGAWVIVWETDDGPEVDGTYDSVDDAMRGAYHSWKEWGGGVVGGFTEGTRAEFNEAYENSAKVWIKPLGDPT